MTVNVDKEKYGLLLMEHIPTVIKSEEQLDAMTAEIHRLMSKGIGEAI